jgi:hypothetical protein
MGEFPFYRDFNKGDQFKIDYPYYGLFGTADITAIIQGDAVTYKCRLLNGSEVLLRKLTGAGKWIDTALDRETPLSNVIGMAIDEFLTRSGNNT